MTGCDIPDVKHIQKCPVFQDRERIIEAPPSDVSGNIETDSAGVGAHMVHLFDNSLGMDIPCETCHVVPQSYFDPGHIDSPLPAEVIFNLVAIENIATNAGYDHNTETCSNVYCHGNFVFSKDESDNQWIYQDSVITGLNADMIWNQVGTGQADCETCHGLPPTGHLVLTNCSSCHTAVVDADNNIIDKSKHINGQIDLN